MIATTAAGIDAQALTSSVDRVRKYLAAHLGDAPELPPVSRRRAGARAPTPAPRGAIDALAATFSLTPFERDVVVLCAGVEIDPRVRAQCGALHGDPSRTMATITLALAALPDSHWSAFSPLGALRRWALVEVGAGELFATAPLRLDERVLHFLLGVPATDQRLACLMTAVPRPSELSLSRRELTVEVAEAIANGGSTTAIQLSAGDAVGREAIAAAACLALGMPLYQMDAHDVPAMPAERELLARLWEREALLAGAALLVRADALPPHAEPFLDAVGGVLIVDREEPLAMRRRSVRRFTLPTSSPAEQLTLWRGALGKAAKGLNGQVQHVAEHFQLGPAAIRAAAATATQRIAQGDTPATALWEACRAEARPRLADLAQRIEPRATWDAIVLPAITLQSMRMIAAQVRQRSRVYREWGFAAQSERGLGVSALFSGGSGTGKTMAAEVVANELAVDLYRVDLSVVVSKYIGETEKNLRRVFDAAEQSGAILLFDEADALFGRRSEVKDSHDRYANVEVSYLLQRIEAYRGLAILTTNLRNAIDPAFLRRLRFVLHFPFPDAAQRAEIWRRAFPPATPTEGLDPAKLAQLSLPGGSIRNVALNAAFLAADARQPVRMLHLAAAAGSEYAKLERALADSETAGWV